MKLKEAFERIAVNETNGLYFHYYSCGIYNQGIMTTYKRKDDPTRICSCGLEEAMKVIASSKVSALLRDIVAV